MDTKETNKRLKVPAGFDLRSKRREERQDNALKMTDATEEDTDAPPRRPVRRWRFIVLLRVQDGDAALEHGQERAVQAAFQPLNPFITSSLSRLVPGTPRHMLWGRGSALVFVHCLV